MPGPFVAPLGVALALAALDVGYGGRVELAGGVAPVTPSGEPEPAVTTTVEPTAEVRLRRPRRRAVLSYAPRAFWRTPNQLELARPLLLHRLRGTYAAWLERRTELTLATSGTLGEIDYTARDVALPAGQGSQVDAAVLDYYEGRGGFGLRRELGRRHTLTVGAQAGQSGSVDDPGDAPLVPTHRFIEVSPGVTWRLARRDSLTALAPSSGRWIGDATLLAPAAVLEWARRVSQTSDLRLRGGAQLTLSSGSSAMPIASFEVVGALHRRREVRVDGRLSLGLGPVLDVIRAEYRPVASLSSGLGFVPAPAWSIDASVRLFAPASPTPLAPLAAESGLASQLAARWLPARAFGLEVGVRQAVRGPHPATGFDLVQPQLWGFVGIQVRESTGPDAPGPP